MNRKLIIILLAISSISVVGLMTPIQQEKIPEFGESISQTFFGDVFTTDNWIWRSGTSFDGTFDHSITVDRTWTLPDKAGTLAITGTEDIITEGDTNVETIDAGTGQIDFDVDGSKVAQIDSNTNCSSTDEYYIASVNDVLICKQFSQDFDFIIKSTTSDDTTYVAYSANGTLVDTDAGNFTATWVAVMSDATNVNSPKVYLPSANYYVNKSLNFFSIASDIDGLTVSGKCATCTTLWGTDEQDSDEGIFEFMAENPSATSYPITAPSQGDHSIITSTASHAGNFNAGDRIIYISNVRSDSGGSSSSGEIHDVLEDGNAGTGEIILEEMAYQDFPSAGSPRVIKIDNFIKGITIEKLTIDNERTSQNIGSSLTDGGIWISQADEVIIRDVIVTNAYRAGILCAGCTNMDISYSTIDQVRAGNNDLDYGIHLFGGHNIKISKNNFNQVRHAITDGSHKLTTAHLDETTWGEVFNLIFTENIISGSNNAPISLHETAPFATISNNIIQGLNDTSTNAPCISSRSNYTLIYGNKCYNTSGGVNLYADGGSFATVAFNQFFNTDKAMQIRDNATNVNVYGNTWYGPLSEGILLDGSSSTMDNNARAGDNSTFAFNRLIMDDSAGAYCLLGESAKRIRWEHNDCIDAGIGVRDLDTVSSGRASLYFVTDNYFENVDDPVDIDAIPVGEKLVKNNKYIDSSSIVGDAPLGNHEWVPVELWFPDLDEPADAVTTYYTNGEIAHTAWEFDDGFTDRIQYKAPFPFLTDGDIQFNVRYHWEPQGGSATQNVEWSIRCVNKVNDNQMTSHFGTVANVTDTITNAHDLHTTDWVTVTCGGSGDNVMIFFEIFRDANAGNDEDDSTTNARFLGAELLWN